MSSDPKLDAVLTNQHNVQSNSYLEVSNPYPTPLQRRTSHTSIFSDISDVEYMSNDHTTGLIKTVSNVSAFSNYSNTSERIVTWREKLRDLYYQNYGALLVLLSQIFGSAMNVAARILEQPGAHGEPMHPFQILFTRQTLTALLCTAYALTTKSIPYFPLGPPDPKVRLLLVSRGLFGFFGVFGMYFSLLYLPLSEATVMTFLAPILTCYICSLVLPGESFTRQQQIAGVVSFVGVVFIAQPFSFLSSSTPASSHVIDGDMTAGGTAASEPYADHDTMHPTPSQHLLAIGIAMLGVCGATGAMTSIRAIGTRAHAFISINYFSVWSSIVSLVAMIVIPGVSFRLPGSLIEWGLLLGLGVCGFILQALLTMGLAYGGPANTPTSKPGQPQSSITNPDEADRSLFGNKATADDDIEMQIHSLNTSPSSSSHHHQQAPELTRRKSLTQSTTTKPHSTRRKPKSQPHPSGNRATSMVYCQMLFALAADKVIFGLTLGVWSWIGSGLILGGAIWVATAKDGSNKSSKPKSNLPGALGLSRSSDPTITSSSSSSIHPRTNAEQVGLLHDTDADRRSHDYDFDEDVDTTTTATTTTDDEGEQDLGGPGSGSGSGQRRRRQTANSIFSTSTLSASPNGSRRSASIAVSPRSMVPSR